MHHMGSRLDGSYYYHIIGYIDYCSSNKISKLETYNMAKEVGLHIEGRSFFWMHPKRVSTYWLKKFDDDNNTIEISLFVNESRIMHLL